MSDTPRINPEDCLRREMARVMEEAVAAGEAAYREGLAGYQRGEEPPWPDDDDWPDLDDDDWDEDDLDVEDD